MDIRCTQCGSEWELDDARVDTTGVPVQCTACGHVFKVRRVAPSLPPGKTQPNDWLVRRANGQLIAFRELTTLQKWIVEGRIERNDEISRNNVSWKRLGRIPELEPFFSVFDRAQALHALIERGDLRQDQVPVRGTEVLQSMDPLNSTDLERAIAKPSTMPIPTTTRPFKDVEIPELARAGGMPSAAWSGDILTHQLPEPRTDARRLASLRRQQRITTSLPWVAGILLGGTVIVASLYQRHQGRTPVVTPKHQPAPAVTELLPTKSSTITSLTPTQLAPVAEIAASKTQPQQPLPATTEQSETTTAKPATIGQPDATTEKPATTLAPLKTSPAQTEISPASENLPHKEETLTEQEFATLLRNAQMLREQNQPGRAIRMYRKAARVRPDSAEALAGVGWCYIDLGQPKKALRIFERARQIDEHQAECYLGLAEAHTMLGSSANQIIRNLEAFIKETNTTDPERRVAESRLRQLRQATAQSHQETP